MHAHSYLVESYGLLSRSQHSHQAAHKHRLYRGWRVPKSATHWPKIRKQLDDGPGPFKVASLHQCGHGPFERPTAHIESVPLSPFSSPPPICSGIRYMCLFSISFDRKQIGFSLSYVVVLVRLLWCHLAFEGTSAARSIARRTGRSINRLGSWESHLFVVALLKQKPCWSTLLPCT